MLGSQIDYGLIDIRSIESTIDYETL